MAGGQPCAQMQMEHFISHLGANTTLRLPLAYKYHIKSNESTEPAKYSGWSLIGGVCRKEPPMANLQPLASIRSY